MALKRKKTLKACPKGQFLATIRNVNDVFILFESRIGNFPKTLLLLVAQKYNTHVTVKDQIYE
jgi:hypothetical protein